MRIPAASLLLLVTSSCGMMMMMPPPTPPPPQVFLVVDEANVIGNSVKGQTTTSGCDKVTQVRLYGNDVFLADAF